jgi:thiol-disulfide isomerase/thioredoxin
MRRYSLVLAAIALVAAGCGDGASGATTSPDTTSDATLATLPPTTTTAPATTAPEPPVTTTSAVTTTTVDLAAGEVGSPILSGDRLPEVGPSPDPAIGVASPVVAGEDYDGTEVTIGEGGSPQAVLFVAHWCGHCQQELPEVVAWLDATGGVDGVEFVLVTVGVDPNRDNFPPSAWLDREGWTGPVMRDDGANSTFYTFGGSSVPYWVFLESDGTVAARIPGRAGIGEVERILQELVAAP